jgi:hypothetical protein
VRLANCAELAAAAASVPQSWLLLRWMAAEGLLSSCARPAASVPSEASFSRCIKEASVLRRRPAMVRRIVAPKPGVVSSSAWKAAASISSNSPPVVARAVAVRGARSMSDISPRNSPALRVASTRSRSLSRLLTSSSPETMM